MTLADFIVIGVIAIIIALAFIKIAKEKKKGAKCTTCVGCPYSGECSKDNK